MTTYETPPPTVALATVAVARFFVVAVIKAKQLRNGLVLVTTSLTQFRTKTLAVRGLTVLVLFAAFFTRCSPVVLPLTIVLHSFFFFAPET